MLSVTSEIANSRAPTSNRFLNKKAIILAAGALFLCISGVTIAFVFSNSSEPTPGSSKIVTDAQNQVASIKDSNSLASDATDTPGVKLAGFDQIKHHVVTNPARTAAIVLAVVAVLVGIIVTAVLLSTSGEEIEPVIPPDPADSETKNGTEGHQTDDPPAIEETGLSESAKIGIGVGVAAAILLILGVVLYFKREPLKAHFCGSGGGGGPVVGGGGGPGPVGGGGSGAGSNVSEGGSGGGSGSQSGSEDEAGSQTTGSDPDATAKSNDNGPDKPLDVQGDVNSPGSKFENEAQLLAESHFKNECGNFYFRYRVRKTGEKSILISIKNRSQEKFKFLLDSSDQANPLYPKFKSSVAITSFNIWQDVKLSPIPTEIILVLYTKKPEEKDFEPFVPEFKVKVTFYFDSNQEVAGMNVEQIKSP